MARGGKRENAGRKAGKPNKSTAEVKELAKEYGPAAIAKAAAMAGLVEGKAAAASEATQIAAVNTILDRAYGKPSQVVAGDPENPIAWQEVRRTLVRPGHTDR